MPKSRNRGQRAIWIEIKDLCKVIARVLGLGLFVSSLEFLRHPHGKGFEEPTKIAIRKSHSIALLRASIHVIPVSIALWEVVLNWHTYWVGSSSFKLLYYQLAAKAHEMMIQSSLAVILFSFVRHEMALGNGIPFGALFSGLRLNQISYLWSLEFWGSVGSKHQSISKKIFTVGLIVVCFVLASVTGPSSAVLLVPRLAYWPAGSTHIWLNASVDDIWPDKVHGSLVPPHCAVSLDNEPPNDCPASEWQFLQKRLLLMHRVVPDAVANQWSTFQMFVVPPLVTQLSRKTALRQFQSTGLFFEHGINTTTWSGKCEQSTTQHAAIADALGSVGAMWDLASSYARFGGHHGSSPYDQQGAVHQINENYYQPYSSVSCLQGLIHNQTDDRPVAFPPDIARVPPSGRWHNTTVSTLGMPLFEYPELPRSDLLKLPGSKLKNRVKWVQLPSSFWSGTTVGLIVMITRNPSFLSQQNISGEYVTCNIGAGWGASSINITSYMNELSPTSSLANIGFKPTLFNKTLKVNSSDDTLTSGSRYQMSSFQGINYSPPTFPSKPIELSVDWAEYLNPFLPSSNTTVIDFLLKAMGYDGSSEGNPVVATQYMVSGLVTNGLARVGYKNQIQGTVRLSKDKNDPEGLDSNYWFSGKGDIFTVDPNQSQGWIKLRVDSFMRGYSYNATGSSSKFSIIFLLMYCAIALAHCFYSGIFGISSTCWDSIAEITALAINSRPTAVLRNTCAGITEIRNFKVPVRILARRDEEGEGEHLELFFGNMEKEEAQKKAIKANRVYGTMPNPRKKGLSELRVKMD